jgi:hypothetical protein
MGCHLPANTQAFETFLTDLEPMLSAFIGAHPRCPANPDLPAVRYAIREFMEEQAPSNFFHERWKASYNPARKVTYCSWFLGTLVYFLDKVDFRNLVSPPVEPEALVFKVEPPRAPVDPYPPVRTPAASSAAEVSQNPYHPAAPAVKPGRQLGSGMPAVPRAWRHWRRGTPRNAKQHSDR